MNSNIGKLAILACVFGIVFVSSPQVIGETRSTTESPVTYNGGKPNDDHDITGKRDASSPEGTVLSDEAIKSLFGITIDGQNSGYLYNSIIVDKDKVDFYKAGTYQVRFHTDIEGNSNTHVGWLTITNVDPTISLANEPVTIVEGETIDNYVSKFIATAQDAGMDLTSQIVVSNIPASLLPTGNNPYVIVFSVTDNEGITVSVEGHLYVTAANHKPSISGTDNQSIVEESAALSNNALIDKFMIQVSDSDETLNVYSNVTVDKTAIKYSVPGTYPVVFTVTDTGGLTETITLYLEVTPVAPTLTTTRQTAKIDVNDPIPNYVLLFGAAANEAGIDLTSNIIVDDSAVDATTPGRYDVVFSVTDNDGQMASKTVALYVRKSLDDIIPVENTRNTRPVISSLDEYTIDENTMISEAMLLELFEVVVTDAEDNPDPMASIDITGVDTSVVKTYDLVITTTDSEGLTATKDIKLHIKDLLPDVTTTSTYKTVIVGYGGTLDDLFSPMAMEGQLDISDKIEVIGNYNFNKAGIYTITFKVTDGEGNMDQVTVKLRVNLPVNKRPIITGTDTVTVDEHTNIDDLVGLFDVVATDAEDGTITNKVTVTSAPIDNDVPGTYTVTFRIQDSRGKIATFNATLIIKDLLPTLTIEKPVIHVDLNTDLDTLLPMFMATAMEGNMDLTGDIQIDLMNVDTMTKGVYAAKLYVSDNDGNTVSSYVAVAVGNITDDFVLTGKTVATTPEELKLSSAKLLELFEAKGITLDDIDLSQYIAISGDVDFSTPGTYDLLIMLTYNEITKYIPVQLIVEDKLPVINSTKDKVTIKGTDIEQIYDILEMFGITATEIEAGDLTDMIWFDEDSFNKLIDWKNNKLNTGVFPVTFSVTDEEGNVATTTKTVEVLADETESEETDTEDTDTEDTDTEDTDSEETDTEDTNTEDVDSEDTNAEDVDSEETDVEDTDAEDMTTDTTSEMTLATTGKESSIVLLGLIILAMAGLMIKIGYTKK